MSYHIDDISIDTWGLRAGSISSAINGYALEGAWSLPKRLGETHYNWQGNIEPYVDADDIHLDGRDLTLNLTLTTRSSVDLKSKIDTFKSALPDQFTLRHNVLGSFDVGLKSIEVKIYDKVWAQITLKLRESTPMLGSILPQSDGAVYGIDDYSWGQLGLVISALENRADLPQYKELSITKSPLASSWLPGYRESENVVIEGTICASDYADFKAKVETLQALMIRQGIRTIKHSDGSIIEAFCVGGFDVTDVWDFAPIHWGKFKCKMIVL